MLYNHQWHQWHICIDSRWFRQHRHRHSRMVSLDIHWYWLHMFHLKGISFDHDMDTYMSMSWSKFIPVHPCLHWQTNSPNPSRHWAPFWHGSLSHSFRFSSQSTPKHQNWRIFSCVIFETKMHNLQLLCDKGIDMRSFYPGMFHRFDRENSHIRQCSFRNLVLNT